MKLLCTAELVVVLSVSAVLAVQADSLKITFIVPLSGPFGPSGASALIGAIAKAGVAILLVKQKLSIALRIAQRVYVMGHGEIAYSGTPDDFKTREDIRKDWLEV